MVGKQHFPDVVLPNPRYRDQNPWKINFLGDNFLSLFFPVSRRISHLCFGADRRMVAAAL